MNQSKENNFGFSKPTIYQIEVEGSVSQDWSERLRGIQIVQMPRKGKKPITILRGEVADQSALAGILKALFEFHLPIISVRKLNKNK